MRFVAPSAVAGRDGTVSGDVARVTGVRGAIGGFRGLVGLRAAPSEAFEESEGHERPEAGALLDEDPQMSRAALDSPPYYRNATNPSHLLAEFESVGCKAKYFDQSHLATVSSTDSPALDAQTLLSCCSAHLIRLLRVIGSLCSHAVNCSLVGVAGHVDLFGSFSLQLADVVDQHFDHRHTASCGNFDLRS